MQWKVGLDETQASPLPDPQPPVSDHPHRSTGLILRALDHNIYNIVLLC